MDKEEAMKILKDFHDESAIFSVRTALETLHPKLKESEDERVRKAILELVRQSSEVLDKQNQNNMISWLEKQGQEPRKVSIWKHWKDGICGNGEGKLIYLIKNGDDYSLSSSLGFECDYIELSDLDNLMLEKQGEQGTTKEKKPKKDPCIGCYYALNHECAIDIKGYCPREKHFDYENANIQQKDFAPKIEQNPTDNDMVEALRTEYEKGRADVIAQMQQEWSEEDESIALGIEQIVNCASLLNIAPDKLDKVRNWLKFIKDRVQPQNTWKPSDAQMVALKKAISQLDLGLSRVLNTLYNDLDKLTKE